MSNVYDFIRAESWLGVRYGCTHRAMPGVSVAPYNQFNLGLHCGDAPEQVQKNRAALQAQIGVPLIWLNQVHGIAVFDADYPELSDRTADAAVTTRSDCALAIMTADCLPVVLADAEGKVVGAAHAGWRSLLGGVLPALLDMMQKKYTQCQQETEVGSMVGLSIVESHVMQTPAGTRDEPYDGTLWRAWLGPAIGAECFEVGSDVRDAFLARYPDWGVFFKPHPQHSGKHLADLVGMAEQQLATLGVGSIQSSGLCTYTRDDLFFSYRRKNPTGRMVTFIQRNPPMSASSLAFGAVDGSLPGVRYKG